MQKPPSTEQKFGLTCSYASMMNKHLKMKGHRDIVWFLLFSTIKIVSYGNKIHVNSPSTKISKRLLSEQFLYSIYACFMLCVF